LRHIGTTRIVSFMIRPLPPVLRGVGLLQAALLLALQLADGSALHRCPAHDTAVPAAGQHAGHAAQGHHDAPGGQKQGQHVCTCLGSCHSGLTVFSVAAPPRSAMPVALSAGPAVETGRAARTRPHHLFPFALAPPPVA